jgi:UDP-N-acetylmuramoylalanine--D-glutamate ligase
VAEVGGVTFLNDSKATNIDALEKALLAMSSPVVLIAGGKDKGLAFAGLRPLVQDRVREVVLIGQMAPRLRETWGDVVPCHLEKTLEAAVTRAQSLARPGDTVLFSPGCSSYDMFRNFEERGDRFRQAVLAGEPEKEPTNPTRP